MLALPSAKPLARKPNRFHYLAIANLAPPKSPPTPTPQKGSHAIKHIAWNLSLAPYVFPSPHLELIATLTTNTNPFSHPLLPGIKNPTIASFTY